MSITLGLWVLPLFVTVLVFVVAGIMSRGDTYGVLALFVHGAATIVALLSWFIWAVLT